MAEIDEKRERDIQSVCNGVITANVVYTGDSGTGAHCPFCYKDCYWQANDVSEIQHEHDCIYLIAKDLTTNINLK